MILYRADFLDFDDFSIHFFGINFPNHRDTECLCYISETLNDFRKFKKFYPVGSNERLFLIHSVCYAHQLFKKWRSELLQQKGVFI